MATGADVNISVRLAFPEAGVVFTIRVETPEGGADGQAPTFHLDVVGSTDGRTIPFKVEASPALADWVRGYSRWLRRANVTATHGDARISGFFDGGLTPEQVLQGVRDACDMIRQRFDLYHESVLG